MFHIIQLIRIKDWVKNFIVFLPLLFSDNFYDLSKLFDLFITFIVFCFASSIIYIFNDIIDIKSDANDYLKKNIKPLARGSLSISHAYLIIIFLLCILCFFLSLNFNILMYIAVYFLLNIFYNLFFKKIPLLDILSISFGYVIRLDTGSSTINVDTSLLMITTIFFLSLFAISMKRHVEISNNINKTSIKLYNKKQLNLIILITGFLSILSFLIFIVSRNLTLILTLPFAIYFLFRYYSKYKSSNKLSPVDIVFKDAKLIGTLIIFFTLVFFILY